jgi:hypothetical protein
VVKITPKKCIAQVRWANPAIIPSKSVSTNMTISVPRLLSTRDDGIFSYAILKRPICTLIGDSPRADISADLVRIKINCPLFLLLVKEQLLGSVVIRQLHDEPEKLVLRHHARLL